MISALQGAGNHGQVLASMSQLCNTEIDAIEALSLTDQVVLAKAIAIYEDTVGGLGSVTALRKVLPLISDGNTELLDWILSNTKSYAYYAYGAQSSLELQSNQRTHAEKVHQSLTKESERANAGKLRRSELATVNLVNAVRRGDRAAVRALLGKGAVPSKAVVPSGMLLAEYAVSLGYIDIADILKAGQ